MEDVTSVELQHTHTHTGTRRHVIGPMFGGFLFCVRILPDRLVCARVCVYSFVYSLVFLCRVQDENPIDHHFEIIEHCKAVVKRTQQAD